MESTAHSSKKYLILFIFIAITAGMIFVSGCIFREQPEVGGLNVAFEQGTQDNQIKSTFEKINFNINYTWYHPDYLGKGYYIYIIIPKQDLNKVQFLYNNGFTELKRTLYYSDGDIKKRDNSYIISLEGEASMEEAQQILKPYNIEVKKPVLVAVSWRPAILSELAAKTLQFELEAKTGVLRTSLVYPKCC
jgi:hypothetical protein